MIHASKPVQLILDNAIKNATNGEYLAKYLLKDLLNHILSTSNTPNDTVDNSKLINLIKDIQSIVNSKKVSISQLINRARSLARNEWILNIQVYHLVISIAYQCNYTSKLIKKYTDEELTYVQPSLLLTSEGYTASRINQRPLYIDYDFTDRLANAIIANDSILIKGPSGVGKYSNILSFIKAIAFKKYPILYKSSFLINPTLAECRRTIETFQGAYLICVIPIKYADPLNVPVADKLGDTILGQIMKCIYIVDTDSQNSMNKIDNISDHISTTIDIIEPNDEKTKDIIKCNIEEINGHVRCDIRDEIIDYAIKATNKFERSSKVQPSKALSFIIETLYHSINKIIWDKLNINQAIPNIVLDIDYDKTYKNMQAISTYDINKYITDKITITLADLEDYITLKYSLSKEVLASMMSINVKKNLTFLKQRLQDTVYGQDEAIDEIVKSLWRRGLKIDTMEKPVSFMFIGKTGTGKCIDGHSMTWYNGGMKKIKNYTSKFKDNDTVPIAVNIVSYDKDSNKIITTEATNIYKDTSTNGLEITLDSGYIIRTSKEHPMWSYSKDKIDYHKAKDMKQDETWIPVVAGHDFWTNKEPLLINVDNATFKPGGAYGKGKYINTSKTIKITKNIAYVIGCLMGDGSLTTLHDNNSNIVTITSADHELLLDIENICKL